MRIQDLKDEKIGICVSGGLDSKTVTTRMLQEGLDVLCFSADLGQPDEEDINDTRRGSMTGAPEDTNAMKAVEQMVASPWI